MHPEAISDEHRVPTVPTIPSKTNEREHAEQANT
jgi:hypothetical protein